MNWKLFMSVLATLCLASCYKFDQPYANEDASTFKETGSIPAGEGGTAEITAYDPGTKKLFVVTNAGTSRRIVIVDISNPASPVKTGFIDVSPYGGPLRSVSVHSGKLAASVESLTKTDPGKVVVFNTSDYAVIKQVTVGALPDMLTFSNDGRYILVANEGEPNPAYTIDPPGTVSIIRVYDNYGVTNLGFSSFASQLASLQAKGLRAFGPGSSFAQDMEPEYICISNDSKTAWVTLQENNAIAKIDISARTVTHIFPLGFKDYNLDENALDPSDRDSKIFLSKWKVKGIYTPDGIALLENNGNPYLFTANEGDQREYAGFSEVARINSLALDPVAFPDAASLKQDMNLGRLNVTRTLGDAGNDGDYDELYSFGTRSFSVWNGKTGQLVFDSKNELERESITAGRYDDNRSDDKGVEPEAIVVGMVGRKKIAFVGLERANAIALYDISDPAHPRFIKLLASVIGPEGITFIPAKDSPLGKSLLIASSEVDGVIKIYKTD
jgi:DNA-binding beta-propeller fold protein YncE